MAVGANRRESPVFCLGRCTASLGDRQNPYMDSALFKTSHKCSPEHLWCRVQCSGGELQERAGLLLARVQNCREPHELTTLFNLELL